MKEISLGIINDEISEDIDTAISFCLNHQIKYIDIRTINKKNIINFNEQEAFIIKNKLDKAGISVNGIASPLFKWFAKGDSESTKEIDLFGSSPYLTDNEKMEEIRKTIKIAEIFNAKYIRIFSGLGIKNESQSEFFKKEEIYFNYLIKQSSAKKLEILMENEPSCNIRTIEDLKNFRKYCTRRDIKILLDTGNIYFLGEDIKREDLLTILPNLSHIIHLKDYKEGLGYITLGEGDIPLKNIIQTIAKHTNHQNISLIFEPHTQTLESIEKSINNIKFILKSFKIFI